MSNPHIQNAIHTIGEANNPGPAWESTDSERIAIQIEANTRATLGLAYEQRTANLIALHSQPGLAIDYDTLRDRIIGRMNDA